MLTGEEIVPARRSMDRLKNHLGPPVLLLLILIGFFWKLTLTRQFTWLENPDVAYQFIPWEQVKAAAFHQGKLPLWDPYLWGGQSLIGQMQPGLTYPLNWIFDLLPLRDGHVRFGLLNWYLVLSHWMAAFFAYWLCRDLGCGRIASYIGGLAFALSGDVGTTVWIQKLNGMIWIPLVLLFFFRAVDGRRAVLSSALCGFVLGISWLAGHHQIPLYITISVGVLWAFYALRGGVLNRKVLELAGVWIVFLAMTSALQILPAYEYGREARRWIGLPDPVGWNQVVPFTIHREFSLGLSSLFGMIVPGAHKYADLYTGPIVLSLAALGISLCWRDARVRILCVISATGFLFSLGYQNVLYGIAYALVPMIQKAREPAAAVVFLNFGAAILAAFGFDGLRRCAESVWVRRVALYLAGLGAVMLVLILGLIVSKQLTSEFDDRIVLVSLLALTIAALYLAYQKQNLGYTTLGVCCLLMLLMDLGNSTGYYYVHQMDKANTTYLRRFSENQDILRWLRKQPGPFRIQVDSQELPFNYGDWYGLEVFNGYVASLPSRLVRLGLDSPHTRMLFGNRYWVSRKPRDLDQVEVFTAGSGLKIYESPGALPRVWTVHRAVSVSSTEQISPAFEDPRFNLRATALFLGETPRRLENCGGADDAKLVRSDFDTVVIEVDMKCGGLVMLSDNYDPAWSATVDGLPALIWDADTVIRGVEAGQGQHRIEMRYRPWTVILGALMLAMSVVGLITLVLFKRE